MDCRFALCSISNSARSAASLVSNESFGLALCEACGLNDAIAEVEVGGTEASEEEVVASLDIKELDEVRGIEDPTSEPACPIVTEDS